MLADISWSNQSELVAVYQAEACCEQTWERLTHPTYHDPMDRMIHLIGQKADLVFTEVVMGDESERGSFICCGSVLHSIDFVIGTAYTWEMTIRLQSLRLETVKHKMYKWGS